MSERLLLKTLSSFGGAGLGFYSRQSRSTRNESFFWVIHAFRRSRSRTLERRIGKDSGEAVGVIRLLWPGSVEL